MFCALSLVLLNNKNEKHTHTNKPRVCVFIVSVSGHKWLLKADSDSHTVTRSWPVLSATRQHRPTSQRSLYWHRAPGGKTFSQSVLSATWQHRPTAMTAEGWCWAAASTTAEGWRWAAAACRDSCQTPWTHHAHVSSLCLIHNFSFLFLAQAHHEYSSCSLGCLFTAFRGWEPC